MIIMSLVIYFILMITVGIYCKKNATSVNDFVLGGRRIGPWLSAFAYGTTYFSAVQFVGFAGQYGWKFGLADIWIGVGNAVLGSALAWIILGRRTRVITQHLDSATMPDFFGKRFASKSLKVVASILIFVYLIPYTATIYNGLSRVFAMAFDVPFEICIIIMALLTCVYTVLGGYMATAITDFIQGIIMVVGLTAVMFSVVRYNGGLGECIHALSQISDSSAGIEAGELTSIFGPEPLNMFGVMILGALGVWGLPQMVQRFYTIKDESAIKKGTIISSFYALFISCGCYFLGSLGRLYDIDIAKDGYDSIVPTIISNLSPILIAIVVMLVLAASMSSLSALVMSSSSTLMLDCISVVYKKKLEEKKKLVLLRVLLSVFIIISVVIAIVQYRQNILFIAQLMSISWGSLAGAFLGPFVYGLYWKKTTRFAVWFNFAFAVIVMILNLKCKSIFPTILQPSANCGAFVMLAGLVIVPVISLLTPKLESKHVENVFSCYAEK